jgi:hypothetical protein
VEDFSIEGPLEAGCCTKAPLFLSFKEIGHLLGLMPLRSCTCGMNAPSCIILDHLIVEEGLLPLHRLE